MKKTVKAWAVTRNGKIGGTFGLQQWIYTTKTRAQCMTPAGHACVPCTITYELPAPKKQELV